MENLVRQQSLGALEGIVATPFVVKLKAPNIITITLIDLPGVFQVE